MQSESNEQTQLVVIARQDGRIKVCNKVCEQVTGYRKEEAVGKNLLEFLVPPQWKPVVQERFATWTPVQLREPHLNPWITKDGSEVMIEWSCNFIPDDDDETLVVGFGNPKPTAL